MIVHKVELNSTLKATTATTCECEVDSSSNKSLWSPTKAIAMEVCLYSRMIFESSRGYLRMPRGYTSFVFVEPLCKKPTRRTPNNSSTGTSMVRKGTGELVILSRMPIVNSSTNQIVKDKNSHNYLWRGCQ